MLAITDPEKRTEEDVITVDNDKFTPITSEGGVVIGYSFTLKAGETITLTDLPLDTAYDIRETDSKGAVEITANGSAVSENEMVSGKIDVENGTAVTFNNTFKTITVEKKYVDDIYSGEVTIDIFRVDGETETLYKTVTLKGNSSVTVTVGNGEYKALVEPDEYILLPELNEDGALEVRDGQLYATGVGRGILAASYGDDGDMVPYRVISPDDITYGDEGTTAVERPMLQPDGGVERLIDFAYIQSGRYARIDFADGAVQEVPYFIYDLNGKLYDRQTVRPQPDCRLPLDHLAKGTYIIVFATGQHTETFKFIVQ